MKRTPAHPMLTWWVKKIEQAEKQPRFPQTWRQDIWHSRLSVARTIWNSWGDINIRCNITYKFTNYKEVVCCALLADTFGVTFRTVGCTGTTASATPKDGEMWRCNSCGLALLAPPGEGRLIQRQLVWQAQCDFHVDSRAWQSFPSYGSNSMKKVEQKLESLK